MFHSRQLNKKINKIQERALRITYKDAESTYSELLEKDCAVTIHTKNLQLLMTEIEVLAGNRNFTKNRRTKIATIIIVNFIFSPSKSSFIKSREQRQRQIHFHKMLS